MKNLKSFCSVYYQLNNITNDILEASPDQN